MPSGVPAMRWPGARAFEDNQCDQQDGQHGSQGATALAAPVERAGQRPGYQQQRGRQRAQQAQEVRVGVAGRNGQQAEHCQPEQQRPRALLAAAQPRQRQPCSQGEQYGQIRRKGRPAWQIVARIGVAGSAQVNADHLPRAVQPEPGALIQRQRATEGRQRLGAQRQVVGVEGEMHRHRRDGHGEGCSCPEQGAVQTLALAPRQRHVQQRPKQRCDARSRIRVQRQRGQDAEDHGAATGRAVGPCQPGSHCQRHHQRLRVDLKADAVDALRPVIDHP